MNKIIFPLKQGCRAPTLGIYIMSCNSSSIEALTKPPGKTSDISQDAKLLEIEKMDYTI